MRTRSTLKTLAVAAGFALSTLAMAQGSGPSGQRPGDVGAGDRTAPVTGATTNRKAGGPAVSGSPANSGTSTGSADTGANAARQAGATNMDKSGTTSSTTTTRTTREQRRAANAEARGAKNRDHVGAQMRRDEPSSPPVPGTPRANTNTADPSRTSPQ